MRSICLSNSGRPNWSRGRSTIAMWRRCIPFSNDTVLHCERSIAADGAGAAQFRAMGGWKKAVSTLSNHLLAP